MQNIKSRENLSNKKKLAVWLMNQRLFLITLFDLLEILCRIYVPFVYGQRFWIIPCFRRSSNPISLAFSNVCTSENLKSLIEVSRYRRI